MGGFFAEEYGPQAVNRGEVGNDGLGTSTEKTDGWKGVSRRKGNEVTPVLILNPMSQWKAVP